MPMMGARGRSRAMRSAEYPELEYATVAAACSNSVTWRMAKPIASAAFADGFEREASTDVR